MPQKYFIAKNALNQVLANKIYHANNQSSENMPKKYPFANTWNYHYQNLTTILGVYIFQNYIPKKIFAPRFHIEFLEKKNFLEREGGKIFQEN